MWPFKRAVEKRDSSYSDALVSLLVSRATGDSAQIGQTWAAEIAATMYSHAFASATITPKNAMTAAITPSVMAGIGRALLRRGESLHLIDTSDGMIQLRPVGSWDVRGGPRESEWTYRLDLHGPSLQESSFAPSASVLHARYQTDSSSPWRGVSPLAGASLSSDLLSALELRLGQESAGPSGYVMPMPQAPSSEGEDDPLARLVADIKGSRGKTVFSETVSSRMGRGKIRRARPRLDAKPIRRESAGGAEGSEKRCGDVRSDGLRDSAVPCPGKFRWDGPARKFSKIRDVIRRASFGHFKGRARTEARNGNLIRPARAVGARPGRARASVSAPCRGGDPRGGCDRRFRADDR